MVACSIETVVTSFAFVKNGKDNTQQFRQLFSMKIV